MVHRRHFAVNGAEGVSTRGIGLQILTTSDRLHTAQHNTTQQCTVQHESPIHAAQTSDKDGSMGSGRRTLHESFNDNGSVSKALKPIIRCISAIVWTLPCSRAKIKPRGSCS
jgi:hypothetical protein